MNITAKPLTASLTSYGTLRQELQPVLEKMECQRRAAISAFWGTLSKTLLLVPLCMLPGLLFVPMHDGMLLEDLARGVTKAFQLPAAVQPDIAMVIFVGGALWFLGGLYLLLRYFNQYGRKPGWDYVRDYKRSVFARVCQLHYADLKFQPESGIGWKDLDNSRLYPWVSDWYQSEDYFEGKVGQTDICFAEATAKRERKRLRKGRLETYLDTYFKGLIFIADFHKYFHSTTRVMPTGEKFERVRTQQPVILEDPDFQAMFSTTSTDQTDARYILSSSMIQRILGLRQRFPGMRALFDDNRLLLLLPGARDRFEPGLYKKADSMEQIREFIRDIDAILPIVEMLNLNTRIWSKP